MRRTWIKLWVDQTLRGSLIEEMNPEQRWIFVALLLLAGDSERAGVVFRRKDGDGNLVGYLPAVLADTVGVEEASIGPALDIMVKKEKVSIDHRGVITICNWDKYQSEYERKKYGRTNVQPNDGQMSGLDREGDIRLRGEIKTYVSPESKEIPFSKDKIQTIMAGWNAFAKKEGLPTILAIPPGSTRERHLLARIKDGFDFEKVLEAIHYQEFLKGDGERGWVVNFDWILNPSNYLKLIEGNYTKITKGDRTGAQDKY